MRNFAFSEFEYPFFVSEQPGSAEKYLSRSEPLDWTEEGIAAIRTVLQKLTALRVLNPTDAEDLVQDTLLTMLIKYPGAELQKGLLVWSMGILRKKLGNYYRRTRRFTPFEDKDLAAPHSIRSGLMAASPEASVLHQELQRIIDDALVQFPSTQRQVIELLLAGLESGEIVRQLHPESYQNVINRLHRGRRRLARELARYGYGPGAHSGLRKMKRCGSHRAAPGPGSEDKKAM